MSETFDLLVVGGGINGVAIARDAAGRGLDVLLCEKGDLAGATSSASVEADPWRVALSGAWRLPPRARGAGRARGAAALAPHLVRPLRLVLPQGPGTRPRAVVRAGLFLYDRLGGARVLPGTQAVDLRDDLLGAPLRNTVRHGFAYSDCRTDDARLTIVTAQDAASHGAEIAPRTALVAARREAGIWRC